MGEQGLYRNIFDVVVEYKQRCYRYKWLVDRSKDRIVGPPCRMEVTPFSRYCEAKSDDRETSSR